MRTIFRNLLAMCLIIGLSTTAFAEPVKIARSLYVGWSPWAHIEESGLASTWGDAYGTEFEFELYQDYLASIMAVGSGMADAVTCTNLEAFNMLSAGGVDVTVLILGDYSNDNDMVITRDGLTLQDMRGETILLVEGSLSQFLVEDALASVGMSADDVTFENISDMAIESAFRNDTSSKVVVTWNPMVMNILMDVPGARGVYGSSRVPGEIMDVLVVKTDLIRNNPDAVKALVGMWYDGMKDMQSRTATGKQARFTMARDQVAEDVPDDEAVMMFENQLRTTMMFYDAGQAVSYLEGREIKDAMKKVLAWIDGKDFGDGPIDAASIGVEFPDGTVIGNSGNVGLRFNSSFTKQYANSELQRALGR